MKMGNYTRQKHNEQDVQCVVLEFILKNVHIDLTN